MTAASGKNAIHVLNNGRTSASYALDIKADAENPGGISAPGGACVYYIKNSGDNTGKDRPIIRIYGGNFSGRYCLQHSGSNGTNCPQFWIYGGTFTATTYAIFTNRALINIYGGTFNTRNMISPDSSAYTMIQGGKFVDVGNNFGSTLNSDKWTYGTSKGNFNVDVAVDEDGYYVVTKPITPVADKPTVYGASLKNTGSGTLAYSNVKTEGRLYYATADRAMAALTSGGDIELYADSSENKTFSSGTTKITVKNGATYSGTITLSGTNAKVVINSDEGNSTAQVVGSVSGYVTSKSLSGSTATISLIQESQAVAVLDDTYYYADLHTALEEGKAAGSVVKLLKDIEALYEEGKALYDAKKYTAALEKLRPAAEKGHKKAQYRVGRCYDKGNGVEENNKLAISWYKKSADQGYYKAEYQMARAYLKGKGGLTADEKKAKAYLKKAVGGKKHGQEMLDEIKKDANSGDEEAVRLLQLLNSN